MPSAGRKRRYLASAKIEPELTGMAEYAETVTMLDVEQGISDE